MQTRKKGNQHMANISTGYGTVTIYAKELHEIAELVYLQYLNEKKS